MPLLYSVRISVKTIYRGTIFSSPVFTSKPIIITLPCPEASPSNKLFAVYYFFSVVFPRKVTKAKVQARALAYG